MVCCNHGHLLHPVDEICRVHASAGEIDPGQIGRFKRGRPQPRYGSYAFVEDPAVAVQIAHQVIDPGGTLGAVGRRRHVHAERVGRDARRVHRGRKRLAKHRIRDDDIPDMRACDVEGLGRGGHHDQPVRDVGRGDGHDGVFLAGIEKVVVNLVRDQDQVMCAAKGGHGAQFVTRPDPATGIVRRAEDQHLFAPGQAGLPPGEVKLCHALRKQKREFHNLAPGGCDDAREGVVNRGHQDHAITRLGKALDAQGGAVHQPMRGENPFG